MPIPRLGVPMRRWQFITLVGAAAAWPLAARAQERMRRIGVLLPAPADDSTFQTWIGAFLQGLGQAGWTIGRNLRTRRPLGHYPRRHSQTSGRISHACARRHPGPWRLDRRTVAAGDPYRADRVPGRRRSGRRRPGRQSGATRWQRHGLSMGLPVRSCEQPADAGDKERRGVGTLAHRGLHRIGPAVHRAGRSAGRHSLRAMPQRAVAQQRRIDPSLIS